jgi:NADP-dependent 3-hydroxy acid dehydrogenase YdfG
MIDTNIKGLLCIFRLIIPLLKEKGRGHVINMGYTSAKDVYPGASAYCATNQAVGRLVGGHAYRPAALRDQGNRHPFRAADTLPNTFNNSSYFQPSKLYFWYPFCDRYYLGHRRG